jgi:hypothetical protein
MSWVGLSQCNRDISIAEYVEVLKSMEGVILDVENGRVRIPIVYFPDL